MPSTRPAARRRKPGLVHVPFTVTLHGAGDVALAGDFNGWSPDAGRLAKAPDGRWRIDLLLPPGEYQYRLVVDGQWRDHPEAQRRIWNSFGTQNCVLEVAASRSQPSERLHRSGF